MLTNIVESKSECPSCGAVRPMAWEFAAGALAGERYALGDALRLDEPYSFYRQRAVVDPNGSVEAVTACPACDIDLVAQLHLRANRLHAIMAVECADREDS